MQRGEESRQHARWPGPRGPRRTSPRARLAAQREAAAAAAPLRLRRLLPPPPFPEPLVVHKDQPARVGAARRPGGRPRRRRLLDPAGGLPDLGEALDGRVPRAAAGAQLEAVHRGEQARVELRPPEHLPEAPATAQPAVCAAGGLIMQQGRRGPTLGLSPGGCVAVAQQAAAGWSADSAQRLPGRVTRIGRARLA